MASGIPPNKNIQPASSISINDAESAALPIRRVASVERQQPAQSLAAPSTSAAAVSASALSSVKVKSPYPILVGKHAPFSLQKPWKQEQEMILGKDLPRTLFSYPFSIDPEKKYGKEWVRRFATLGAFEQLMLKLKPNLKVEKAIPSPPHSAKINPSEIFQLTEEINIEPEDEISTTKQDNVLITAGSKVSQLLEYLQPNMQYILTNDKCAAGFMLIAQNSTGQWCYCTEEEWLPIVTNQEKIRRLFDGEQMALYEVTERRVNILCDFLYFYHQQGRNAAEKSLQLAYAATKESKKEELEKLFPQQNSALIKTQASKTPNMSAERCLAFFNSAAEYQPQHFVNAEQIELIDPLILSEEIGEFLAAQHKVKAGDLYISNELSEQQLREKLQQLDTEFDYLLRLGQEKGLADYYQLFYQNGSWYCTKEITTTNGIELLTQNKELTPMSRELLLNPEVNWSTHNYSAIFIKASAERREILQQYINDYRYLGSEKAKEKLGSQKQKPLHTLVGTRYYAGYVTDYAGLHSADHAKDLLPENSDHQWRGDFLKDTPAHHEFALCEKPWEYSDTNRFMRIANTCGDETLEFLEYLYGVEREKKPPSDYHQRTHQPLVLNEAFSLAGNQALFSSPLFSPLNSTSENHWFEAGYTQEGILSWLNNLDRRLPYVFTTQYPNKTNEGEGGGRVGHIMALYFFAGNWYVYNSLTPDYSESGTFEHNYVPTLQAITRCVANSEPGKEVHNLTEYGKQLLYAPNEEWGIKNCFLVYTAIDKSRLAFLRTYIDIAREKGTEHAAQLILNITANSPFAKFKRKT